MSPPVSAWLTLLVPLLSAATELHEAAATGNSIQISALVKAGASVSAQDDQKLTPLHLAAAEGHAEAVKLLLGVGASLDAQDFAEQTPLHLAASQGQAPIIRVLVEAGASLEARDDQKATPLLAAPILAMWAAPMPMTTRRRPNSPGSSVR